ncbi:FAD-binding oxidoreductase [Kocuria sp. M1R5S2]|uniref:FAD-binding oxidoreductase n=1 Tax=Kocuria rhizosphaerae TaxID=3376285 RepID=UPI0037A36B51
MDAEDRREQDTAHPRELEDLRARVSGTIVEPDDPLYDDARRVWNGMVDARPLAVVRAGSVADVDPVLSLAQHTGLPLAVRGGGHGVAGHGTVEGGIVLDLGALRRVDVDPASRLVTVEPGATLADVDRATNPHGLAVPLGVVSATGVAGLTLGGGVGWLTRSDGLTLDHLVAADVVTGTREHLHADARHNPDLFWGLRGGGGNFGVVTSFTFRARELPVPVLGANLFYRREKWRGALRAFARWTADLPDAMNSIASVLSLLPGFGLGEDPVLILGAAWVSPDTEEGLRLLERLRAEAPPDEEEVGPVEWPAWQSALDELFPKGSRAYWKNAALPALTDEVLDVLVGLASEISWYGTGFDLHHMGGFFGRVPAGATAFPNRSARYWLNVYGYWQDPAEDARLTAFARRVHAAVEPFTESGQYVNFLGAEHGAASPEAARQAYGERTHARLVALKDRFDPGNVLRRNHNIPPSSS